MKLKEVFLAAVLVLVCINIAESHKSCCCKPHTRRCPSGYRSVLVNRVVCKYRRRGRCPRPRPILGSLGFVIDDTGSMRDDISRRQKPDLLHSGSQPAIPRLCDAFCARPGRRAVRNYINAIKPSGGGDCPEYSLSAIRDAAKAARPNSMLYLFTDASAKDARLKASVAALLRRKRTRLYVVRSGRLCGSSYKGEYDYLAKRSGGGVIRLRNKKNVKYVLKYIGLASAGRVPFRLPSSVKKLRRIRPGHCPRVYCPRGYRRVVKRRRICKGGPRPPPRPRRLGSLGFVIDVTGSMKTEIRAVRSSISSVIAANRRFRNYVLATFSDPYKRKVVAVKRKSSALKFLRAIRPNGGGDCPEYSLSGVRDAARRALSRSVLFLFTDASAKDARLKRSVARLLKRKKIRLFVVKTGKLCGRAYKREYDYLARVSGGKVITLPSKSGVSSVMNFMKLAAAGKAKFSALPKTLKKLKKFSREKMLHANTYHVPSLKVYRGLVDHLDTYIVD
uniref:VWFA domain-containing protein n=1 Tax=Macrostomum lignano TaxID=282301 RepID=A0A1I8I8N4_9PLAT